MGSGTPATIAGMDVINVTEGNEPLPRGEYKATGLIGTAFSPT